LERFVYRHDAAQRGGIVIIAVDDTRGQSEISSSLVVIASLDDAREFYTATQGNWRDRPDRFHDDADRFRAFMTATVGTRSRRLCNRAKRCESRPCAALRILR